MAATGADLTVDRAGVGSATPLAFTLDFNNLTGLASVSGASELIMASQDGAPAGILIDYSIDADGIVTGAFSNQLDTHDMNCRFRRGLAPRLPSGGYLTPGRQTLGTSRETTP